jgi:hypothetical protein
MRRTWPICLAFCAALAPAPAAAGANEDARNSFQQGVELYKEGKFAEAAIAFARAYELKPSYKILYNIGQSEAELSHYAKALDAYNRYLEGGGKAIGNERTEQVGAEITRLHALVGGISISSEVDGATVFVDDAKQGETPLQGPLFVDIGEHLVVVRKDGSEIYKEKVTVAGGSRAQVKVEAPRAAVAAPAAAPTGPQPAPKPDDRPAQPVRLWTWVAFGVGGAAAVGAGIAGGLALDASSDLDSACSGDVCPASKQETIDRGKSASLATDVMIGVAAAGVVAGVVLYFLEPGMNGSEVEVTPAAAASGGGLLVSGRF